MEGSGRQRKAAEGSGRQRKAAEGSGRQGVPTIYRVIFKNKLIAQFSTCTEMKHAFNKI